MTTVQAGDVKRGAEYIATHPDEYGIVWAEGAIGKGTGKDYVELRKNAPHILLTPENVPLFVATFPAATIDGVNGTSVKVKCDRVNRNNIRKDHGISNDRLRVLIVQSALLGVITRTVGSVTRYVGADGKTYATLEAAQAAVATPDREARIREAQAFLAMCSDSGVTADVARDMARKMFPDVYDVDADADDDDSADDSADEQE